MLRALTPSIAGVIPQYQGVLQNCDVWARLLAKEKATWYWGGSMLGDFIQFFKFMWAWVLTIFWSSAQLFFMVIGLGRWSWEFIPYTWSVMAFSALGIRISVKNEEKLVGPAVFVLNHQSLIDVVLVPYILPRKVLHVVKSELRKVPVFGPAVCNTGAISVDRKNIIAAMKSIEEGVRSMPEGYSVMVFPEGTRSEDGRLRPFKKGFAYIAMEGKLPIIPIGIAGAIDSCGHMAAMPRPGLIECTVGDAIDTSDWTQDNLREKVAEVKEAVRLLQGESEKRRYGRVLYAEPSPQVI